MGKKRKSKLRKRDIPYCADPENHVLVETRESVFWRKRRSNVEINGAFATNVDLSKISGPAARRVVQKLRPFMKGIEAGRITLRVSNALRKFLKEKKHLSLSALKGEEMQRDYPLHQLLLVPYEVIAEDSTCRIRIGIEEKCVKKQNALATHFYFEGILLFGDLETDNGLRTEHAESKLYAFGGEPKEICELNLSVPDAGEWIVLLKVSCLEGNEMAVHAKHYGMKVVKGFW
jgi:hypothetical protein